MILIIKKENYKDSTSIKIIKEYEGLIKYASRQVGEYSEECEQQIKVALFIKLAKNRK